MESHKYAALFPKMAEDEFNELVESIRKNGLREKIITHEGRILDGLNREAACEVAGVKPQFEKFKGKDPLQFVVDKNLNRRHLSTSQRSMIAAEIATATNSETSITEAAKTLGVSRDSVHTAKKVKKASKKLAKQVKTGKISLNKAKKKISPPKPAPTGKSSFEKIYGSGIDGKTEKIEKDKRTLGQICYDAYLGKLGAGESWDDLKPEIRAAFQAGAEAVKKS
jgi:ParB-like chromosome segregation protein Spo0J